MADDENKTRLIAKVLRTLLEADPFADYADLKDALRGRLRTLRIAYRPAEFHDAISIVGSNRPVVESRYTPARHRVETAETFDLSRQAAAARLTHFLDHLKAMRVR